MKTLLKIEKVSDSIVLECHLETTDDIIMLAKAITALYHQSPLTKAAIKRGVDVAENHKDMVDELKASAIDLSACGTGILTPNPTKS